MEGETRTESLRMVPESDPTKIRGVAMHAGKISYKSNSVSRAGQPAPAMKAGRLAPDAIPNRNRPASVRLGEILGSSGWAEVSEEQLQVLGIGHEGETPDD